MSTNDEEPPDEDSQLNTTEFLNPIDTISKIEATDHQDTGEDFYVDLVSVSETVKSEVKDVSPVFSGAVLQNDSPAGENNEEEETSYVSEIFDEKSYNDQALIEKYQSVVLSAAFPAQKIHTDEHLDFLAEEFFSERKGKIDQNFVRRSIKSDRLSDFDIFALILKIIEIYEEEETELTLDLNDLARFIPLVFVAYRLKEQIEIPEAEDQINDEIKVESKEKRIPRKKISAEYLEYCAEYVMTEEFVKTETCDDDKLDEYIEEILESGRVIKFDPEFIFETRRDYEFSEYDMVRILHRFRNMDKKHEIILSVEDIELIDYYPFIYYGDKLEIVEYEVDEGVSQMAA